MSATDVTPLVARVSSAKDYTLVSLLTSLSISPTSTRKMRGPRTLPWGTLDMTGCGSDSNPLTNWILLVRKASMTVIDLAVYIHIQQLVEHNIEVNFVKCLGIIQIDDISIIASFKDVEEVVNVLEELT